MYGFYIVHYTVHYIVFASSQFFEWKIFVLQDIISNASLLNSLAECYVFGVYLDWDEIYRSLGDENDDYGFLKNSLTKACAYLVRYIAEFKSFLCVHKAYHKAKALSKPMLYCCQLDR